MFLFFFSYNPFYGFLRTYLIFLVDNLSTGEGSSCLLSAFCTQFIIFIIFVHLGSI